MSSTVNGYEGTGRSLSLKLIKELKERGNTSVGGIYIIILDIILTTLSFRAC
jgi:tRNA(Met) C34 N-acetyltransferase TmcA